MTEQNEQTKPTKPLTLSTTTRAGAAAKGGSDATQVRQKFSHGRTRVVAVEVKKPVKRPTGPGAPMAAAPAPAPEPRAAPTARTLKLGGAATTARPTAPARPSAGDSARSGGAVLKTLTEEEKEARARALVGANRDAEVARQRAAQESARRAVEEEARKKADEEHKKRLAEEEARKKSEEEVKRKADALVQRRLDQAATASPQGPVARQAEEINAGAAPQAAPQRTSARPPTECGFCGGVLPTGRVIKFCPHCGQNQSMTHCPACQTEVEFGWRHCIGCGQVLAD